MRFRQAMSILASAMEEATKLYPDVPSDLCSIINWFKVIHDNPLTPAHLPGSRWRYTVAALCRMAGVTERHMRQLEEHIQEELKPQGCSYAFLTTRWASECRFGLEPNYCSGNKARAARCAWLRTLGRTVPAKVKHAAK